MEFLDTIFGLKPAEAGTSYMFNWAQLGIAMGIMTFCIFFSMWYFKRDEKVRKRFLIIATIFLALIEIGRIIFRYFFLKENNLPLTFLNIADLSLFTLSVWITLPLMIIILIRGRYGKLSQTLMTFIFSITAVFALFDLIYPVDIETGFSIIHIYNLMFIFNHAIVLLMALFMASSGWLLKSIDDIWKAIFCLLLFAGICTAIYYASGKALDLAFLEGCPVFELMGLEIAPEWHVAILGVFFFCCQVLMYIPFDLYRRVKYGTRKWKNKYGKK